MGDRRSNLEVGLTSGRRVSHAGNVKYPPASPARQRLHATQGPQFFGKALVLLNLQNDFFSDTKEPGRPFVGATTELVRKCNQLRESELWDLVIVCGDCFPSNHLSFKSNNPAASVHQQNKEWANLHTLLPDHCVIGSKGQQFHPDLHIKHTDILLLNGRDPTTIPWGTSDDHLSPEETPLIDFLHAARVCDVFLAGLPLDGKVLETAIQLADVAHHRWEQPLRIHVVRDACIASAPREMPNALSTCRKHNIGVISISECLDQIAHAPRDTAPPPRYGSTKHDEICKSILKYALSGTDITEDQLAELKKTLLELAPVRGEPNALPHCAEILDRITGYAVTHDLCRIGRPNCLKILKLLLDNDLASISLRSKPWDETPMILACRYGQAQIVRLLLFENSQSEMACTLFAEETDCFRVTPMLHVIATANVEIVQMLAQARNGDVGVLLRVKDKYDRNALIYAAEAYHHGGKHGKDQYQELQKYFPEKHFHHHIVDKAGWCFWHFAVKHGLEHEIKARLKGIPGPINRGIAKESENSTTSWMKCRIDLMNPVATQNHSKYASISDSVHAKTSQQLTMLHLVVGSHAGSFSSRVRQRVLEFILPRFRDFDLHNAPTASGMNALDIALEALDPSIAFELVKGGCIPCHYAVDVGHASTKVLLYKALFLGEASIVRILLSQHAHNVKPDRHLLNLALNQKYTRTCANHFATFRSDTLQQPWYRVDSESDQLVCVMCALTCHKANHKVSFQGVGVGHGRCQCATTMESGCTVSTKVESQNTHANVVRVPQISVQRRHLRGQQVAQVAANALRTESRIRGITGEAMAANERMRAMAANTMVARASTDLHYDYIIKVLLFSAASYGQVDFVHELARMVSGDIEFTDLDESEETPIHAAIRHHQPEVVSILVTFASINSKLDTVNAAGASYLTLAAAFGYADICRMVATDENVFKLDCLGFTPIHHAVRNNHPSIVRHLARYIQRSKLQRNIGARITFVGSNALDDMHLHDVAQPRPTSGIGVAGLNATNFLSPTFPQDLHGTAAAFIAGTKVPLDMDEVPESYFHAPKGSLEAHANPLHLAVRYCHYQCVNELLSAGASPSTRDFTGFAPYKTALWQDYEARKSEQAQKKRGRTQSQENLLPVAGTIIPMGTLPSEDSTGKTFSSTTTNTILRRMLLDPTIRQKRRRFAFKRFYQEMMLPSILALVFLMLTLPKSSSTYLTHRWIWRALDVDNLESYKRFDDVWGWVDQHLVNSTTLFPASYESANSLSGLLVLGPVRLRQQKSLIELTSLDIVHGESPQLTLPRRYREKNENKTSFAPETFSQYTNGSNHWGGLCSGGIWNEQTNNPWVYQTGVAELKDTDSFGSYGAGGYMALLHVANGDGFNQQRLNCLHSSRWIDETTRAMIVDISLFNMNTGMFTAVHILVSFGMTGEMVVSFRESSSTLGYGVHDSLQVAELNRFDYPSLAMEIVVSFQLVGILFAVAIKCLQRYKANTKSNRYWAFLRATFNFSNVFDLVLVGLLIVLLGFDLKAYSEIKGTFDSKFRVDRTEFVDLSSMIDWVTFETGFLSFVTLMVWIRVLVYCLLLPVVGPLIIAVFYTIQAKSVLTFLFLLIYVLIGFTFAFRMVMAQVYQCREYVNTFVLLVQMMIEEWNDSVYSSVADTGIGPFLFIVFMLAVALVYMNLFISVLSEVYPYEKRRAEKQYHDMISQASQIEYIKRSNPLLRPASSNSVFKFLHSIIVRPVTEHVSRIVTLLYPQFDQTFAAESFGWTDATEYLGTSIVDKDTTAVASTENQNNDENGDADTQSMIARPETTISVEDADQARRMSALSSTSLPRIWQPTPSRGPSVPTSSVLGLEGL